MNNDKNQLPNIEALVIGLIGRYLPKIKAVGYILQYESKTNFLQNQILPVFNDYDKERRAFLSNLSIISAAIGAFSFTLFKSEYIKTPNLLIAGDIMLLCTIVSSITSYLVIFCKNQTNLHNTYFNLIKTIDSNTRFLNDFVFGKVSESEGYTKIKELEEKKPDDPKKPKYKILIANCVIFSISILMIGLSFIQF